MSSTAYSGASATAHTTAAIVTAASGSTMVAVVVNSGTASPSSVSPDSKGNTYTLVNSITLTGGSYTHHTYICSNAAGGAGHTFTANFAVAATCSILFYEETTGGTIAGATKATGEDGADPRLLATAAAVDSGALVFFSATSSFGASCAFAGNDGYVKLVDVDSGATSTACALFSKAAPSTAVQTGSCNLVGSDATLSIFGMGITAPPVGGLFFM